jgi:hypothetical protein
MIKSVGELYREKAAFDSAQNDLAIVRARWPNAPHPSADYFTRGRVHEFEKLKPLLDLGAFALVLVEQYRKGDASDLDADRFLAEARRVLGGG